eukprot:scaffold48773_cov36-Phaeocystis_antarctica.AAC.1
MYAPLHGLALYPNPIPHTLTLTLTLALTLTRYAPLHGGTTVTISGAGLDQEHEDVKVRLDETEMLPSP